MAATDDPVFLELLGEDGREFRPALNRGKSPPRGQEEPCVFGSPEETRAFGEMDDRLELTEGEIEIHTGDGATPRRFGPRAPSGPG